jgi:adenylosuccinate lyase
VIGRYSRPEMAAIFSDTARLGRWLEVELLATEAWSALGVVPSPDAAAARSLAPVVDAAFVAACAERERVTDHDVAAFVDVVQAAIADAGAPEAAKWIHYGLTSSDVVDTAWCWMLRDAADLLLAASDALVATLKATALHHRDTAMIGRTHGIHAEPTTFGTKVALWCLQADRDRARLRAARAAVAVGKLSGAVGTYANVEPFVERHVCDALGLTPVPATQVIARDRHAEYLWACASVGTTIELIAVELRHLQRTEVREVEEGFAAGQKGSSAMPHKRNPITAERLAGLARILRGEPRRRLGGRRALARAGHLPLLRRAGDPARLLTARVLRPRRGRPPGRRAAVAPERMLANLWSSHGLVFSQPVLLALVAGGLSRDAAYRIVQDDAMRAWDEGVSFRSLLEKDERVTIGPDALDEAFSLQRSLRHIGAVFEVLEDVPG